MTLLICSFPGPVTGILLNRFGCRLVAVAGSLILFVGLLASVFIPSLPVLYATYGIIGGMEICNTVFVVINTRR